MEEILMKVCTNCGEKLPAISEYFSKQKTGKYGFASKCKKCYRKTGNEYYKAHKERAGKYYSDNKDKFYEYSKQWHNDNKDWIKKYTKKYYHKNKERIIERQKQYYCNNKENLLKASRQWLKFNKNKTKEYYFKRRKAFKQLPNTLTNEQWEQIKNDFNNMCAYCGEELLLQKDHFVPISKGGEYTKNNIIPSCRRCNSKKHNSDFLKWYPQQEFYSREREKFILIYLGYKEDK